MLASRFKEIYEMLLARGMKKTAICKKMGYTTTAQLHGVLNGKGILSTRVIYILIDQLDISPNYLFLGIGNMFRTMDENDKDLDILMTELSEQNKSLQDKVIELTHEVKRLNGIIDMSIIAINNLKTNGVCVQLF
jgi:hypothetical protein